MHSFMPSPILVIGYNSSFWELAPQSPGAQSWFVTAAWVLVLLYESPPR